MEKLFFEKLANFDRQQEPCSIAIPFPKGELHHIHDLTITDGIDSVPTQGSVTGYWPDGSIKWGLIYFLADIPANQSKTYYYTLKKQEKTLQENPFQILDKGETLLVDNGLIQLELNHIQGKSPFHKIQMKDFMIKENEIQGPYIKNQEDQWVAILDGPWEIIEAGPVITRLQSKGKHHNQKDDQWMDYILNIELYAGKPWFKTDYKIINKEEQEFQILKSIEFNLHPKATDSTKIKTMLGHSNYRTSFQEGTGEEQISYMIDADHLLAEANEHMPEVFYGTFFADWTDEAKGGICATLFQAHQNFPKAFEVDGKRLSIQILPHKSEGLTFYQGMAKTHTFFLHLHDSTVDKTTLNQRSLHLQMPDRPILDSSVYERSNIYNAIFTDQKIDFVERGLINMADRRGKAYGILHWGDAPDSGYTEQGRGGGGLVWTNNEYDFPHAMMQMYARTGERRMLDYLLVAARHWMDIDVCHYSPDPLRQDAQITHSANHVSGEVEISHEWVQGLLDYYHQTGDTFAYDTAIRTGKNILRWLDEPRYHKKGEINARETGWALRSLVALYKETNDPSWLEKADFIVGHFEEWKELYGEWLAPYTDHSVIRVPFMIAIAVGSLMRYYKIKPEEKIKNMVIDAVDDMVEHCILENGLFYYKELPSLRRLGNNTLVLEALVYAYELTGDKKYLEAGIPTFESYFERVSGLSQNKKKVGDAIWVTGQGPKGFAQSFYPIVSFYVTAVKNNII